MGKTLTWEFIGKDKTSPELQKIARSFDDTAKRAAAFGKDGSKALSDMSPAAARAKAATEDMASGMSDAVQRASDRITVARQRESDQLGRLRLAETRLAEVRENSKAKASQLVAAEESVAAAHRKVEGAQLAVAAAQRKLVIEREKAAAAAARDTDVDSGSGPKIDLTDRIARVKEQAIGELKSAGILAGAAFAGGLGAGLSTVGAAGFFVAIAAAAQSSNEKVAESYKGLWNQIKNQVTNASSVLSDEFIASAETLGRTMNNLQPQLVAGFAAAQPVVENVTEGLARMATSAMPGIVTGAKAASTASEGLADAMDSAGKGVSNFFTESAQGADAGADAFRAFGTIVERLGTFAGRILADLANSSSQTWPALTGAVDSTATAIESLAKNALPALASGAAMSLNAFSLLLNLATTVINALGPAAPMLLTFATALKAVDMVSFGGVKSSWDDFKRSIADAPGIAGKAKAGFSGLVGTLGPIGIAAGIATLSLDAIGRSQQRAAEEASAHQARIRSLTDELRQSGGVINDNVRALAAKALADKQVGETGKTVLDVARESGISLSTLNDAYLGNADAVKTVNTQLDAFIQSRGVAEDQLGATGIDEVTARAIELKGVLPELNSEYGTSAQRARDLAAATGGAAGANAALKKSIEDLQNVLAGLADKNLAYRNSVDATEDAQKAASDAFKEMTDAQKKHGTKSPEYAAANEKYTDSVRGVEGAMLAQANAARDLAVSTSTANSEAGKAAEGQVAYAKEVMALAVAAGESAPPALRQMISGLNESELAALGASKQITGTGETVIRLPNGKTITIAANDQASQKASQIAALIAAIKDRFITIGINEVTTYTRIVKDAPAGSMPLSQGRKAKGGWVSGPGTTTSDSVPMLLSNREYVVRASEAQKNRRVLEAINAGKDITGLVGASPAAMTAMQAAVASPTFSPATGPTEVRLVLGSDGSQVGDFLLNVMQRSVRIRGGNVQAVLGTK